MQITYDVSKQKGSSRWYPHKVESPKVAAGPLADKKTALHAADDPASVSFEGRRIIRKTTQ